MPRSVVTQLMFEGKAEEAMTLYVSLFGGSVSAVQKYGPGHRVAADRRTGGGQLPARDRHFGIRVGARSTTSAASTAGCSTSSPD